MENTTRNSETVIGPDVKIKGSIEGAEDLIVMGRVEGTISIGHKELVIIFPVA